MLGIRVEGSFHWGFWVRIPNTSKVQPSLQIPPPTTLIGALAYPLFRRVDKGEVEAIKKDQKEGVASFVKLLDDTIITCSIYLVGKAYYIEDSSKYITLSFQRKSVDKRNREEVKLGGRRYLPRYRSGTIKTGKVIYPDGMAVIAYLLNLEKLTRLFGKDIREEIENAAWQITRVGSKESIFSVNNVETKEMPPLKGDFVTKFYFPATAAEVSEVSKEDFYYETFWRGGWGNIDDLEFIEYVVPGKRGPPIKSVSIKVEKVEEAYQFRDGEVLII